MQVREEHWQHLVGRRFEDCDCWEVLRELYRSAAGVEIPGLGRCSDGSDSDFEQLRALVADRFEETGSDGDAGLAPLDVVFERLGGQRRAHVSVVVDVPTRRLITSHRNYGVCLDYCAQLQNVLAVYRLKGEAD